MQAGAPQETDLRAESDTVVPPLSSLGTCILNTIIVLLPMAILGALLALRPNLDLVPLVVVSHAVAVPLIFIGAVATLHCRWRLYHLQRSGVLRRHVVSPALVAMAYGVFAWGAIRGVLNDAEWWRNF
jgi:hypothetical protein